MYFTGELHKRMSCILYQKHASIYLTRQYLHQLIYYQSLEKPKYSLLSKLLILTKFLASDLLLVLLMFLYQAYEYNAPEPPHDAIVRLIQ